MPSTQCERVRKLERLVVRVQTSYVVAMRIILTSIDAEVVKKPAVVEETFYSELSEENRLDERIEEEALEEIDFLTVVRGIGPSKLLVKGRPAVL